MAKLIIHPEGKRICGLCKEPKEYSEYFKNRLSKDGLTCYCRTCSYKKNNIWIKTEMGKKSKRRGVETRKKNSKEKLRWVGLKSGMKKVGISITPEQYHSIRAAANNKCEICGRTPEQCKKDLHIDHCHETKQLRGLLCSKCNTALGLFNDDINLMKKAITYLQKNAMFSSYPWNYSQEIYT